MPPPIRAHPSVLTPKFKFYRTFFSYLIQKISHCNKPLKGGNALYPIRVPVTEVLSTHPVPYLENLLYIKLTSKCCLLFAHILIYTFGDQGFPASGVLIHHLCKSKSNPNPVQLLKSKFERSQLDLDLRRWWICTPQVKATLSLFILWREIIRSQVGHSGKTKIMREARRGKSEENLIWDTHILIYNIES